MRCIDHQAIQSTEFAYQNSEDAIKITDAAPAIEEIIS